MFASSLRILTLIVAVAGTWPVMANGADSLNLTRLEYRLRNSEAIDWLQKVKLNADVEDLKARIETRLTSNAGAALGDLQGHFNRLFDTVLAMLRDADPRLHRDMLASRHLIWTTLSQPKRSTGS